MENTDTVQESGLPQNLKNLWLKAISAIELRNYGYAISLIQAVLKEEPKFLDGRRVLRKAEVQKASTEKKLIKFPGGGISSMKFASQIKKDPLLAIIDIEKVLESNPHSLQANQSLHDAATAAGLPTTAGFALETVWEGHSDNSKVGHQLAGFYMEHDDPERASKIYQDMVKNDHTDLIAVQGEKNAAARASMKKQKWDSATDFRELLKDQDQAANLEQESRAAMTPEQINELLVDLGAKYAADPNNLAVVKRIGVLYEQLEDWANALTYFEWAHQLSGGDTALERRVSEIRDKQREGELVRMEADLAAEEDEGAREEKAAQIGALRKEQGDRLIVEARARVEGNPTDAQLRFELGEHLFATEQYSEAIPELQKAKNNAYLRVRTLIMIGKCYDRKNMNDLAVRQYNDANEELFAMDDTKKEVLYNLGLVYHKMGKKTESLDAMKQIYEADYGYRD
ncbi:MAG: tetratricopeptide repeat protein, partial [Verrucomicrobiales bacterium]